MDPTQPLSPGTPPPIQPGGSGRGNNDQWLIFGAIGCVVLLFSCLCAAGVGGVLFAVGSSGGGGGLGIAATTVHVQARVTSYLGLTGGIAPGTMCDLPITAETQPDGTQQCHVLMTCGGVSLYGDAQSGFFPCQFSTSPPSVMGQDTNTTMSDQDGAFFISTTGGNVSLSDDFLGRNGMFTLQATITSTTAE